MYTNIQQYINENNYKENTRDLILDGENYDDGDGEYHI